MHLFRLFCLNWVASAVKHQHAMHMLMLIQPACLKMHLLLILRALSAECLNTLRITVRLFCRRELRNQQPLASEHMAAADVPFNGQKEELPSAAVAQHIGGDYGLDNGRCESKQPR